MPDAGVGAHPSRALGKRRSGLRECTEKQLHQILRFITHPFFYFLRLQMSI
jgi:hypothetical protein